MVGQPGSGVWTDLEHVAAELEVLLGDRVGQRRRGVIDLLLEQVVHAHEEVGAEADVWQIVPPPMVARSGRRRGIGVTVHDDVGVAVRGAGGADRANSAVTRARVISRWRG